MSEPNKLPDSNVVLPGFEATFSDVVSRFPVPPTNDWQQSPPTSNLYQYSDHTTLKTPTGYQDHHGPSGSQNAISRAVPMPVLFPSTLARQTARGDSNQYSSTGSAPSSPGIASSLTESDDASKDPDITRAQISRQRRILVCSICNKEFSKPSTLETHMNSHTGAKPHKCPSAGCDKTFSSNSNMNRHLRQIHLRVSPDSHLGTRDKYTHLA